MRSKGSDFRVKDVWLVVEGVGCEDRALDGPASGEKVSQGREREKGSKGRTTPCLITSSFVSLPLRPDRTSCQGVCEDRVRAGPPRGGKGSKGRH